MRNELAPTGPYIARCRCGRVELEATGPCIAHISCYCDDCQLAADQIEQLPGGVSGREPDGGSPNVLFRKDRVRCVRGVELLEPHRTRAGSHTIRFVASCCNTAIRQIHENWWPHSGIKSSLFDCPVPPLQVRMFTKFAPDAAKIPNDVPRYSWIPLGFALRLLTTAVRLRLGR